MDACLNSQKWHARNNPMKKKLGTDSHRKSSRHKLISSRKCAGPKMLCHAQIGTWSPSAHLGDSALPAASPRREHVQLLLREQPAKLDHFSLVGSDSVLQNQPYSFCTAKVLYPSFNLEKYNITKRAQTGSHIFAQRFTGSPWPPPSCRVITRCWVQFLVKFLVFLDNQGLWSLGDVLLQKLLKVALRWRLPLVLLQR